VKIVADSHAIVWHLQGSERLSPAAATALAEAEATDGVVVSVATLIDLWYVIQTTKKLADADLAKLRDLLASSPAFTLRPIDLAVVNATTSIPRDLLTDPWDRFIVATARTLAVALITRDRAIRDSRLVPTIW
jgi:PIN domain nuclease of toxin-antitoxin system